MQGNKKGDNCASNSNVYNIIYNIYAFNTTVIKCQ